MAKKLNLTGKKFGRLTVYSESAPRYPHFTFWDCVCECGSLVNVRGVQLTSGKTKSCGCITKGKFVNLLGKKIGKLLVIKKTEKRHPKAGLVIWLCKCDCGAEVEVISRSLISANTKSCGCLRFGKSTISKDSCINSIYLSYAVMARRRKLEFKITPYDFINLVSSNCYYCGGEPSNIKRIKSGATLLYNGIDRIDNFVGYISDNVVTCCKICNVMKNNLSMEEFMSHIRKIIILISSYATDVGTYVR